MKITRGNYEIYFMDYLDGNLSAEDIRELKAFLIINSDIEETLDKTDFIPLIPREEQFQEMESLKKEIYHECPDYYAIAASENELTPNDRKVLGKRISTPVFQSQTAAYARLRLKPDPEIRFEKKKSLYRKSNLRILAYRAGGLAAGLLLLFGLGLLFPRTPDAPETTLKKETPVLATRALPLVPPSPSKEPAENTPSREKPDSPHPASPQSLPAEQKEQTSRECLPPFPVPPTHTPRLASNLTGKKYRLKVQKFSSSEIYLTVYATQWKQSGEDGLFSETILAKAIESGKKLTEKIKVSIANQSNKTTGETVIEEKIENDQIKLP